MENITLRNPDIMWCITTVPTDEAFIVITDVLNNDIRDFETRKKLSFIGIYKLT